MPPYKALGLGLLALLAFAGNSLLNRAALADGSIDPASFTIIRLVSGAIMLSLLFLTKQKNAGYFKMRQWRGGVTLFAYAACFSFAYLQLETGTGALLLFPSVHLTMQAIAIWKGERPAMLQWTGLVLALAGLFWLLGPGTSSPPVIASLLMILSGLSWALYSLLGFSNASPVDATRNNFVWAALLSILLLPFLELGSISLDGILLAIAAGAITSALGYVIWYAALPGLGSTVAGASQLLVPSLAALGGVVFLGEQLSQRLVIATALILSGIALTLKPTEA